MQAPRVLPLVRCAAHPADRCYDTMPENDPGFRCAASGLHACAATSPAPRSPTNGSSAMDRGMSCCNSKARGATAPRTSGCRRWNSCGAGLRAAIVPGPPQSNFEHADEHAHGAPARLSWSRLRWRVFDLDVGRCVCGGKLKIIAAIEEPAVIVKILTHLGLPARAPPRSPARPLDLFQAA